MKNAEGSGRQGMSKFDSLWSYIHKDGRQLIQLTFDDIERISGVPLDHSFLNAKKETAEYGFTVGKISMKKRTVVFEKKGEAPL